MPLRQNLSFFENLEMLHSSFYFAFSNHFLISRLDLKHFDTLNIAINTADQTEHAILIKFNLRIQIVMFRRGPPGTSIVPAPAYIALRVIPVC